MKEQEKIHPAIKYLPIFGCFSTGLIYVAIGVIAILSFLRIKRGGADEASLLAFLEGFGVGKIFVYIILAGLCCYIAWRIYESLTDPYRYGNKPKGIDMRVGIALSAVPDGFIAYSAIMILMGQDSIQQNGQPEEQRKLVGSLLEQSWGEWLITATGFIIAATAMLQLVYGYTRGYK